MMGLLKWVLYKIYRYEKGLMIFEMGLILLSGIFAPVSTLALQNLVNEMISGDIFSRSVLMYIGIIFLKESIFPMQMISSAKIKKKLSISMMNDMAEKVCAMEYSKLEDKKIRNILLKISEKSVEEIHEVVRTFFFICSYVLSAVGYLIYVVQVSWGLAVVYGIALLLNVKINLYSTQKMAELYSSQTLEERKIRYFGDLLLDKSSLMEIKIFQAGKYIIEQWKSFFHIVLRQRVERVKKSQMGYIAGSFIGILWIIVVLIVLVLKLQSGSINYGVFLAMIESSGTIVVLSVFISEKGIWLSKRISLIEQYRLFEELDVEKRVDFALIGKKKGIEFQDVVFTYPESKQPALRGVSFDIKPDEVVAIVGENGAGKSTILKLICGLYKSSKGKIFIDGRMINDTSLEEIGKSVAVVFQDFERYELSIRENILMGNQKAIEDEDAIKILKEINMDELCGLLDEPLGKTNDNGIDLSGGQWQKVAIARALLSGKRYIILDEPTASIDPISENNMYELFRKSLKGRTGIIISHRLVSARLADRVLVLRNGKIVESGTHDELVNADGFYAKMWRMQSGWYQK